MTRRAKCPMCTEGVLTGSDGKLDQSGNTYLPTTVWTCDTCGCVRYERATVAQWKSHESSEPAGSGRCGAADEGALRAA